MDRSGAGAGIAGGSRIVAPISTPSRGTAASGESGANDPEAGERPIKAGNPSPGGKLGPLRHLRKFLLAIPLFLAAATGCQSCASQRALQKEVASAPRDPDTGVILGTEAISLGPPDARAACLLVHGFVGSRKDFADLGERLAADGYYVRMMRLPGHGTTPREFAALGPEDLLAAARAELKNLESRFDRVYLIGFSMGGAISTELAAEEGNGLAGVVLLSPYYRVTYHWYYVLPPMLWNRMFSPVVSYVIKTDRFVRVNLRESVSHIFSYRAIPTRGALTLEALGREARDPSTLRAVRAPLLLLQAEGDEAASPEAGREAFAQLGSTVKSIHMYGTRSNHHLLWDYDGEDAKLRILDFLDGLEGHPPVPAAGSSSGPLVPSQEDSPSSLTQAS